MDASKPVVIVLHGPTGVGKDSVIDLLRERTGIHRPTSTADRKPRPGERDGEHYHFVTPDEFRRRIERGDFIEHADVYGEKKGVAAGEILRPLEAGRDIIIRTDVHGARTWREKFEGAVFVILLPENIDALRARLLVREGDGFAKAAERLSDFDEEVADAPNNDYIIYNRHGELDEAVAELERIVALERTNPGRPSPRLRQASVN